MPGDSSSVVLVKMIYLSERRYARENVQNREATKMVCAVNEKNP